MKIKAIILMTILGISFTDSELSAQNRSKTPIYKDVTVNMLGDSVEVSFTLFVSKKALKRNYVMTIEPILSSKDSKLTLPIIEVYSRYSSLLEKKRYHYQNRIKPNLATYSLERGDSLSYTCRVGYESWMDGASLVYGSSIKGCCKTIIEPIVALENYAPANTLVPSETADSVHSLLLAKSERGNITTGIVGSQDQNLSGSSVSDESTPLVSDVSTLLVSSESTSSVIQNLKAKYTAVSDISEYKYGELIREGSVTIYFEIGSSKIDVMHRDNIESLKLLGEIASIAKNDSNVILEKVVIAGFASIEDTYDYNLKLSERRSESLRQYVSHFTSLNPDILDISYKGEDWHGLYEMVKKSKMQYKQEVMDIIDNVSLFEGREMRLMNLKGGVPYNYMKKHFFPEFRKAGYIHFYYKAN